MSILSSMRESLASARASSGRSRTRTWIPPLSIVTLGTEASFFLAWGSSHLAANAGSPPAFAQAFAALVASTGVVISLLLAWVVRTHIHGKQRAADISHEMTRALRASEAASLAKSQFLANMSHEIRTPLTAILGYADLLRSDASSLSPATVNDHAGTIHRAAEHLLAVINDILDFSKIEAGGMQIELVDLSLSQAFADIDRFMQSRAVQSKIALHVRPDGSLPDHILTDPTRFRQILLNLVGNAIKFTSEGSVTLSARLETTTSVPTLLFDVEDTGIGIEPDIVDRLFAPFVQADASVTRKHGGTGLGLSISRRLARLMGGDVVLLHSTPGVGSCFRFSLPLRMHTLLCSVPPLPPSAPARANEHRPTLSGRILLVEDGVDNQRLISHYLRQAGAHVEIASNGRMALDMLARAEQEHAPFSLLLSDMQMPEMDGYTLAQTLRSQGSTIAIVALTAHALADDRDRCLAAGCDEYASKPVDKDRLFAVCLKWMGKQSQSEVARRSVQHGLL